MTIKKTKLLYGLILLCTLTQSLPAYDTSNRQVEGGVWTGGGGEVVSNQFNPWFVGPHRTVSYCISSDAQRFSLASSEVLKRSVNNALSFWTNEFKDHPATDFGFERIDFLHIQDCDQADLSFMFGAVNVGQADALAKAKVAIDDYIGLAFQSSYDEEQLRGRGFVYLAPDDGSVAAIPQGAWSEKNAVYDVLLHELGHVFGIQHQTAGFMSYNFPNIRVSRTYDSSIKLRFFEVLDSVYSCDDMLPNTRKILKEIFQEDRVCESMTQYSLHLSREGGFVFFRPNVLEKVPNPTLETPVRAVARVRADQAPFKEIFDYPILLQLNGRQKVFDSHEKVLRYPRYRQVFSAHLELGQVVLPVSIMTDPLSSSLRLSTIFQGKVLSDIFQGH